MENKSISGEFVSNSEDEVLINPADCKTSPYDIVKYLTDEKDFPLFLKISYEENGVEGLQEALIEVARAKIINDLTKKNRIAKR